MEQSVLTAFFLPLALFFIMLCMGMTLSVKDFRSIVSKPGAVFIGLGCQLLILPGIAFLIVWMSDMRPELAVGFILISLCPGGPVTNLITFLARGDLALSVSLTALSSTIVNVTIPLLLNLALLLFMSETQVIRLPVGMTTGQIFIITVVPVSAGMWLSSRYPVVIRKSQGMFTAMSGGLFVMILAMVIFYEWENIPVYFAEAGIASLVLNLAAMTAGYAFARGFVLNRAQQITISIETGVQNGSLAIALALSPAILNNSTMAVAPAIYSLVMFATASVIIMAGRFVEPAGTPGREEERS